MTSHFRRRSAVSSLALVMALAAHPALAQDADAAADGDDAEAAELAGNVIVVTAQKREESLQEVPIAVTAFSDETLDDKVIDDAVDLSFSVPNLTVNDSGASLRGVGNLAISSTSEGGLGYHVNGAYIGSPATTTEYFDIERIEVLRGPQGTLYGRNTTAGVLNIITRKPGPDLGGYVTAGYGNYDNMKVEGAVNLPVGDALAFRAAGFYLKRDGYARNLGTGNDVDGRDMFGVRGTIGLDLGNTTATLMVNYFEEDDSRNFGTKGVCLKDPAIGCSPLERGFETPDSRTTIFSTLGGALGLFDPTADYFAGALNPTDLRTINQDIDPRYYTDELFATLEISHDFGDLTLTSLTSYQDRDFETFNDFDRFVATSGTNYPVTFDLVGDGSGVVTTSEILSGRRDNAHYEQWTQELRLASDFDGPFNFLLGANYYDQELSYFVDITHTALANFANLLGLNQAYQAYRIQTDPATTESWGLFGEVYFDLSDRTTLTGGLRYSHDDKTIATRQLFLDPVFNPGEFGGPEFADGIPFTTGEFSKGVFTGRVVLDHEFSGALHGYVSASRGYKAGGINPGGATVPTFDPEYLNAGEIGLKFAAWDGAFLLNSSAFYYDYSGLQIGQVGVTSANTVNTDATVYGAEFEWVVTPPESNFQFDGSLSLLHSEIKDFQSGDEGDPNAIAPGSVPVIGPDGQPLRNGSGVIIKDLDGNELPFSPNWKLSLGVQYRIPLGGDLELTPRLDHYQQGGFFGTAFAKPIDFFDGYSQTDFKLLLAPVERRWELRGYVKNLFDNDDVVRMSQEGPLVGRFRSLIILEPRTYGVEATYRF